MPLTTPVPLPTVAMLVALLLHVPPANASVSVVVYPVHTVFDPPMAPGIGFTVTVIVE